MKAVIVEDEIIAAKHIENLIKEVYSEIEVIAVLRSIESSVEWFSANPHPDIVFMDIHLADGLSFSIFEKVRLNSSIIFITAYDEYALEAFEVNSVDYLLKPINKKELYRAIKKHLDLVSKRITDNNLISNVLKYIEKTHKIYKSYFLIPNKDKLIPLAVSDIAYFHSENKMIKAVSFSKQEFFIDGSLEDIFSQLDPTVFFRVNRQYIISHKCIHNISIWFGSKISINLHLPISEKIVVSKARVSEFKSWIQNNRKKIRG